MSESKIFFRLTQATNTYKHIFRTSIQLKLKVVVGVCNYVIFLANIFI